MTPQIPADGILKTHEWGDSKVYRVACESSVHLTKQQALNYAETLKSAIIDVEDFRKKNEQS